MARNLLIPGTSLRASALALGTMPWGTRVAADRAAELYALYRAQGGNILDTAHIYAAWEKDGAGASERTLGRVLQQVGDRRQVIVISKGGHPAEHFYPRPDHFLSPERVRQDITESLDRLGLDMIDLYFLHRDDSRVPVGEIISMMNEEVSEGRIRYFGASNWCTSRMEEANAWAARADKGLMGFVASQPEFNLAQPNAAIPSTDPALRWLTPADVAWHDKHQMPAFCYSPTAQGYFGSAGTRGTKRYENETNHARLARVQQLSRNLGVTPNQVALAWVMAHRFAAIPILGTGNIDHLNDALGAMRVALSPEQVRWLRDG